jgi:hypothetical protein
VVRRSTFNCGAIPRRNKSIPSNFERLNRLPDPVHQIEVERVDDDAIRNRISLEYARSNYVL